MMQYSKVEISGVNTRDLKALSEDKKMELLAKVKQGDKKGEGRAYSGKPSPCFKRDSEIHVKRDTS